MARSNRSALSAQYAPSSPFHALACSAFDASTATKSVIGAPPIYSLWDHHYYSHREDHVKPARAHHHLLRRPQPARGQALEHVRADPPDGPQPGADLAASG